MKRLLLIVGLFFIVIASADAQLLTCTPDFPKDNDNITITVDATKGNQGLLNFSGNVYVHVGLITSASMNEGDWKYVLFGWGTTPVNGQATPAGTNKWSYTINNIRTTFGVAAGETVKAIAILFRDAPGDKVQRNANTTIFNGNMYVPVYDNSLALRFTQPLFQPYYAPVPETITKSTGDNIAVTAITNQSSSMKLYLNGNVIQTASSATTISVNPTLTVSGNTEIVAETDNGTAVKKDTIRFFTAPGINTAPLPAGVRDGINYETGNTSAVLVLYAPNKNRVSLIGEFPGYGWTEQPSYVMNKTPDGNYWWVRLTGLTPGNEYAFQYLVDGTIKVGEPYAEKILDPSNDGFITAATYPLLKAYPVGLTTGNVSILQTNAPAYNWTINNFSRPDKRNLVIYELLVRDFVAAHDWKTLRDTLSYLQTLGINAIEIMPFNEFDGNESWGYNPSYFLAPDKYYGPKNLLKEFIDTCHRRGIAVIMDIALNHTTGSNPLAALYWNAGANKPASNNPWLNVDATHPYNVFNDFNHESLATRYFCSRVLSHWLQEYKIDGYRFDLSKGFTQNAQCGASTSNEACISQYHADRVAILKRYYDTCQLKSSGSYVILEHFAENSEEIELSNYGMMLWGNNTYNFQEASRGVTSNTNFEGYLHSVRGWTNPYLVSYMESHDEERLMYRNLNEGNTSNPAHNIRELNTALKRVELCASFFLTAPGPKMIWQFGERGFDLSINRCENGTISNDCRLSKKPPMWEYMQNVQRKRLYDIYSSLNKLRAHPWYKDVFIANGTTISQNMGSVFKWLIVRSATDSSMLCVVGNFDVTERNNTFTFPSSGTWYDYLRGGTFTATGAAQTISLDAGEYRVFVSRNLSGTVTTPVTGIDPSADKLRAIIYPNPANANSLLEFDLPVAGNVQVYLSTISGQDLQMIFSGRLAGGKQQITLADKINNLPAGVYLLRVQTAKEKQTVKLIIR
ncbi:MAG TPA: alpha-amylase family glycosyl hydrolase [Chitinophagaceae bacterium]